MCCPCVVAEALFHIKRRCECHFTYSNTAPFTGYNRSVTFREDGRQRPARRRREPQPQQVTFALTIRPIIERGAVVKYGGMTFRLAKADGDRPAKQKAVARRF